MTQSEINDYHVRFKAVFRLLGNEAMNTLAKAHICVIGLGGVGSWSAEALARCGVGNITLVDFDEVCKTNVNRQIHAVDGEFHKPKVQVMTERIAKINPRCAVSPIQSFFTYSTADSIFSRKFDYVIDAMDSPSKKCLVADKCKKLGIPLIMTGATGGKLDPTKIRITDLSEAFNDRLLQEVRKKLRAKYGFPNAPRPMGIEAVYSIEPARRTQEQCPKSEDSLNPGLNCETGLGAVVFLTGTFGFVAVSRVIMKLTGNIPVDSEPVNIQIDKK